MMAWLYYWLVDDDEHRVCRCDDPECEHDETN
jgi:hypothetical protein